MTLNTGHLDARAMQAPGGALEGVTELVNSILSGPARARKRQKQEERESLEDEIARLRMQAYRQELADRRERGRPVREARRRLRARTARGGRQSDEPAMSATQALREAEALARIRGEIIKEPGGLGTIPDPEAVAAHARRLMGVADPVEMDAVIPPEVIEEPAPVVEPEVPVQPSAVPQGSGTRQAITAGPAPVQAAAPVVVTEQVQPVQPVAAQPVVPSEPITQMAPVTPVAATPAPAPQPLAPVAPVAVQPVAQPVVQPVAQPAIEPEPVASVTAVPQVAAAPAPSPIDAMPSMQEAPHGFIPGLEMQEQAPPTATVLPPEISDDAVPAPAADPVPRGSGTRAATLDRNNREPSAPVAEAASIGREQAMRVQEALSGLDVPTTARAIFNHALIKGQSPEETASFIIGNPELAARAVFSDEASQAESLEQILQMRPNVVKDIITGLRSRGVQ